MISKALRQQQILELLGSNKKLSPTELSTRLSVSEMTIRRDIKELYMKNQINAFYGGVCLADARQKPVQEHSNLDAYHAEEERHLREKQRIARYASRMIELQDVIAIDNGSTCNHIPDYLTPEMNCLIYTYSLSTLNKISKLNGSNLQLFALGGYYHGQLGMFEHADTLNTIKKCSINKLFLGAVGVSIEGGLSCVQPYEIPIRKALIEQSKKVVLLADSSKIGKSWFDHYAPLSAVDTFITDSGITKEQKEALKDQGLEVVVV